MRERFVRQIQHLAKLIVVLAHVAGTETTNTADIGDMQLILRSDNDFLQFSKVEDTRRDPAKYVHVDPIEAFHAMAALLCTSDMDGLAERRPYGRPLAGIYLCSDYGWSVLLDTVGHEDPSDVRPERIHLQRGTPTDKKTLQRKFRILDGRGIPAADYPEENLPPPQEGNKYQPRCVAQVSEIAQYWRIQQHHFELTLHFRIKTEEEWYRHTNVKEFEEVAGFRCLQECLWQTFSTPPCKHGSRLRVKRAPETKLGSDAAAVIGWFESISNPILSRILIFLTRGDKYIRWVAIKEGVTLRREEQGAKEISQRGNVTYDDLL
jgi:hypothetical protein